MVNDVVVKFAFVVIIFMAGCRWLHSTCLKPLPFYADPKTADWPLIATPWPTVALVGICLRTRGGLMCLLGGNKCINLDSYINFISDPKTADWPLVATPWPTVAFVAVYLFIVKVGPKFMETRKAYNLREALIVYNFALVLLSGWMVYEVSAEVCFYLLQSVVVCLRIPFSLRSSKCFVFLSQFIASVLDIPNFNYMCEPIHYVRGDARLNRVSDDYLKTHRLNCTDRYICSALIYIYIHTYIYIYI